MASDVPTMQPTITPKPSSRARSRRTSAAVSPPDASWSAELGEFVLPYDAVATADDPDAYLMSFLESTHAAAADLAGWDRAELECDAPHGPDWWQTRPHRR